MNRRLLLSLLPLTLAACSPSTPSSGPTSGAAPPAATSTEKTTSATPTATTDIATLGRHHWQLSNATDQSGERIAALFAHPDKPLQLDFVEGRISVDNACNRLGGSYRIDGDKLQVGPMVHTMMACADPAVKALDGAIDKRLHDQPTMTLLVDGDTPQLKLVTGDGDTLQFTGQPTAETRYGSQGKTAFLEVAARTVPCNHPEMPARQCLKVRERRYDAQGLVAGTPGEWQPLNQAIEGYTHRPGVRNVLRVTRYTVKNPPADASSAAYVLDTVVESETVKP
jgi:heat shock protein HslJ